MFVFLALVFGVGFVAFGVGSDVQGGIADAIGVGGGGTGQPSVEDSRERLEENPNDPTALRDLATALQTDGRPEEAIAPLERYVRLRPNDEEVLRQLAGVHLTKATRLRNEAQEAQLEAQALAPGTIFQPPANTPFGQALSKAPITQAATQRANERLTRVYGEMQSAYRDAKETYVRLARLAPEDPSIQLQLADAAINSGDTPAALTAYRRFVKLAPDDPTTPLVRQEIKRLQAASALQPGG